MPYPIPYVMRLARALDSAGREIKEQIQSTRMGHISAQCDPPSMMCLSIWHPGLHDFQWHALPEQIASSRPHRKSQQIDA